MTTARGANAQVRGVTLQIIGILVQLVSVAVDMFAIAAVVVLSQHKAYTWMIPTLILASLAIVTFRVGKRLVVRGRRHRTSTIVTFEQVVETPFILYLRSFADDRARQEFDAYDLRLGRGHQNLFSNLFLSSRTQEERIAGALKPFGRVVAVGSPGESLPPAGAHRMYLPADAWQDTVADLMQCAQLVVVAAGASQSLVWELRHAVGNVPPDRLALLVVMSPESYEDFRQTITKAFVTPPRHGNQQWAPPRLPTRLPEHESDFTTGWVIWFTSEWIAKPVPIDLPKQDMSQLWIRTERSIRTALWPILKKLAGDDHDHAEDDTRGPKERAILIMEIVIGAIALGMAGMVVSVIIGIAVHSNSVALAAIPALGALVGGILHRPIARRLLGPEKPKIPDDYE